MNIHESNLKFAKSVEPNNQYIKEYNEEIIEKNKNGYLHCQQLKT